MVCDRPSRPFAQDGGERAGGRGRRASLWPILTREAGKTLNDGRGGEVARRSSISCAITSAGSETKFGHADRFQRAGGGKQSSRNMGGQGRVLGLYQPVELLTARAIVTPCQVARGPRWRAAKIQVDGKARRAYDAVRLLKPVKLFFQGGPAQRRCSSSYPAMAKVGRDYDQPPATGGCRLHRLHRSLRGSYNRTLAQRATAPILPLIAETGACSTPCSSTPRPEKSR